MRNSPTQRKRLHRGSLRALSAALAFCLASSVCLRADITWTGDTDSNNSGTWSTASNWDGSAPGTGDTAVLVDVTSGTRTVTYDSAATGILGALVMTQNTAGAVNRLNLQRNFTLSSALTVGASAGSAVVSLGAASAKVSATLSGLTVNSGGTFIHDFNLNGNLGSDLFSNVVVNSGGTYQVGSGDSGTSALTAQATITRNVTFNEGSVLILDTANRANVRLAVQGTFSANGATFYTTSGTGGYLTLDGTSSSLVNTDIGSLYINVRGSGEKTFYADGTLNRLYVTGRNSAALTLSITAPTVSGLYLSHESANSSVTLKLAGNMTNKGVQLQATGGVAGTTTYIIDTNGHTLDLSTGYSYGKWTPNKGSETTAVWTLRDSASGGALRASAFDFSATSVETNVEAGAVLEAVSNANSLGQASNLSGTGTIDAASEFRYNSSYVGTLQSNRSIGLLHVQSGTLSIVGTSDFSAAGGIEVDAGGTLNLASRSVGSARYTFGVSNGEIGVIKGGVSAISLTGVDIVFNFSDTILEGAYSMFEVDSGITGTPDSVTLTGLVSADLAQSGDEWSGISGGYSFVFSESTGLLSVTAIPEPAAAAALLCALALLCGARRRA